MNQEVQNKLYLNIGSKFNHTQNHFFYCTFLWLRVLAFFGPSSGHTVAVTEEETVCDITT
jgi:hypothetical protein